MYDEIQCSGFDGDFDNHAAEPIRREAHRPMERIGGFMRATRYHHRACACAVLARRTPWSSPSPLVKTQHKTQLLASVYRTFYLAKLSNFITRKGPSTHVIDATSFV